MNVPYPRLYPPALVALLLGLASVPLLAVAGIVAMIVGFRSLRHINASDGALRGARLAIVGMALSTWGQGAKDWFHQSDGSSCKRPLLGERLCPRPAC